MSSQSEITIQLRNYLGEGMLSIQIFTFTSKYKIFALRGINEFN